MTKKMTKTIKKALIDQDRTITDVAREIGYTRGYVSNAINGHFANPPEEVIRRLLRVLNIKTDEENSRRAA